MYRITSLMCLFMVFACFAITGCEENESSPTPTPTSAPTSAPTQTPLPPITSDPKALITGGNQSKVVASHEEAKASLYAIQGEGELEKFRLEVDGGTQSFPYWRNVSNPTYAPNLFFNDLNRDRIKELIVILTKGYGTGVLDTEVHVFHKSQTVAGFYEEVLVDNPKAIVLKNVKRKLNPKEISVTIGVKETVVNVEKFDPANMYSDIGFGSRTKFDVVDNQLMASVSCQISPAGHIGEILITFEYKDGMYQASNIDFASFESEPTAPVAAPTANTYSPELAFPSPSTDLTDLLIASYSINKTNSWFIYRNKSKDQSEINIFYSADSGESWVKSTLPIKLPWEMEIQKDDVFVSLHTEQEAIPNWILLTSSPAAGLMDKTVYQSTDHGKTWSFKGDLSQTITSSYITGISFRNELTGWITGTYHGGALLPLFRTKDGGKTWGLQEIAIPEGYSYGNAYPPSFNSDNSLNGTIRVEFVRDSVRDSWEYRTTNGGETWTAQSKGGSE